VTRTAVEETRTRMATRPFAAVYSCAFTQRVATASGWHVRMGGI
jgi:hypothetical protein